MFAWSFSEYKPQNNRKVVLSPHLPHLQPVHPSALLAEFARSISNVEKPCCSLCWNRLLPSHVSVSMQHMYTWKRHVFTLFAVPSASVWTHLAHRMETCKGESSLYQYLHRSQCLYTIETVTWKAFKLQILTKLETGTTATSPPDADFLISTDKRTGRYLDTAPSARYL